MSLSTALNIAQRSLSNTAMATNVVSRNVANAENPNYVRRAVQLESDSIAGAQVSKIARAQDEILYRQNVSSIASESGQSTLVKSLDQLRIIFGTNDYELSPAVLAGKLRDNLSAYAAKPNEPTLAETAVASAEDLARSLQTASNQIQKIRTDMDTDIASDVAKLNDMLVQFETVNTAIKQGTATKVDVNDYLDEREMLIKEISKIVEVRPAVRSNNDVALYTMDGTTLFEKIPRSVTFEASPAYGASTVGNGIYIDGVPLQPGSGSNTSAGGSLQAKLQIRDDLAPMLQGQLDEIARGLITVYAEKDQTGGGAPDLPGLFTWSTGTVPPSGTRVDGIAAMITVNSAVMSSAGGDPKLLRDGGINGAAYVYNTTGAAGYSERLDNLVTGMGTPIAFDGTSLLGTSKGLIDFAADSIGWLELTRSDATSARDTKQAYNEQISRTLSNATGVSIDEEMSLLLTLEQSYKAATRILSVVDELFNTLMSAAR
ncbi:MULTISPECIES: flagellar hook-associated protein FlgK [unclassified Lentilitoribacter]|jgi:flagellar hook-associated protein 1 FlgK|uniref:flagellar hook-associated protein FlgK n=1 Tax=unclassified Lentilitoribacter TaxID=2647570 RepID=UPI0013A6E4C5|nr:flagellar hook-associated protein FlgK [Lentilitoribacter sp. Alg239-R112]